MAEQLKTPLAIGMAVLAALVFFTAFGYPLNNSRPLIPALVPVLGMPFGIVFGLVQAAYCLYYRLPKGTALVLIVWTVAGLLVLLLWGRVFEPNPQAMSGIDRVVTGAACAGAIALGLAVWRRKV